jgi:hypothetical protein
MPVGRICVKMNCLERAEGRDAYCAYHKQFYATVPDPGPSDFDVAEAKRLVEVHAEQAEEIENGLPLQ